MLPNMVSAVRFCIAQTQNARERVQHARSLEGSDHNCDRDDDLAAAAVMLDRVLDALESIDLQSSDDWSPEPPTDEAPGG